MPRILENQQTSVRCATKGDTLSGLHPDENENRPEATEIFKNLQHAYDILRDNAKRTAFENESKQGGESKGEKESKGKKEPYPCLPPGGPPGRGASLMASLAQRGTQRANPHNRKQNLRMHVTQILQCADCSAVASYSSYVVFWFNIRNLPHYNAQAIVRNSF
jgi:hypothetical protein